MAATDSDFLQKVAVNVRIRWPTYFGLGGRHGSESLADMLRIMHLPRLYPGVVIHIHDICLPYEYPKVYFTNPGFRVFWTEAYMLQAFLTYNSEFEVLMAMNYLMVDHIEEFKRAFRHYDANIHKLISGSFWIRRKTK